MVNTTDFAEWSFTPCVQKGDAEKLNGWDVCIYVCARVRGRVCACEHVYVRVCFGRIDEYNLCLHFYKGHPIDIRILSKNPGKGNY